MRDEGTRGCDRGRNEGREEEVGQSFPPLPLSPPVPGLRWTTEVQYLYRSYAPLPPPLSVGLKGSSAQSTVPAWQPSH